MTAQTNGQDAMDELLNNPFGESKASNNEIDKSPNQNKRLVDQLPEENRKKAEHLAAQIDTNNHQALVQFGTEAQSKLIQFSHEMLEHVQEKDISQVGSILENLMKRLEQVDPSELQQEKKGIIAKVLGKFSKSVNEVISRYQKTSAQIDRISVRLERNKDILTSDNEMLDKLFQTNRDYYDALNIYIAAGELKQEEIEQELLPSLRSKADQSQSQMDVQEVNDMRQFADRLQKRTHDLRLSRQITMQSAPQIRLIQNTNQALVEKIQSSVLTAIPLWKNQVAIALTLLRQRHAMEAQKQVSKTTNDLLLKNAELLNENAVETTKENERGIIDLDTLKQTQEKLMSTIEETLQIQSEGRKKRTEAEKELMGMEEELKQKMLEFKE
ncbi:toxic anion resistance protein [Oceanobacillus kimchii]|uniref:toxic anion resistance protein n=1 Tax=Oceanobacillus TaxID=182709 RepID=UPI00084ECF5A|nr:MULTISPECIES: toxic anion resistance protein [Oceanobacillus]MCT1578187.1 toxic anion resistance protein [Oceanobacillus kimchii]MCT2134365.1 toxic anion resistance protein [Oceanobacillus kimchii]OEH55007.1 tellurite resistance protein TelA [Oceanobacillus sp. E9]